MLAQKSEDKKMNSLDSCRKFTSKLYKSKFVVTLTASGWFCEAPFRIQEMAFKLSKARP